MKNPNLLFLGLIFSAVLLSCQQNSSETTEPCETNFPSVIVTTLTDSVKVGEVFRATVSLSDSSYYFITDFQTGKRRRTYPVFRVNGDIIETPKSNVLQYEEIVTDKAVYSNYPNIRKVSFGVIIPPQNPNSGEIEFGIRYEYIALPNN